MSKRSRSVANRVRSVSKVKLSVIIPAFNVERTLRSCVESVVRQRVDDMEIIIIDDGSTDATPTLADTLSTSYDNVIVVHQSNRGLSAARNSGISLAKGEYITFVDSDDCLAADSYPALIALMDSLASDILEYSFVRSDGVKEYSATTLPTATYATLRDYWLAGHGYEHAYAWNKLFRRHIFDPSGLALRFEEGRTFEDTAFLVALLSHPLTITTTPLSGYIYTFNPLGITATADATAMQHLLSAHLAAFERLNLCPPTGQKGSQRLTIAEEDYYMSVVNIQITVCRMHSQAPQLPSCRVAIHGSDLSNCPRLVKKILLNLFGIRTVCRLFALV